MNHEILKRPIPRLGIVIPAYNEEETIGKTVLELRKVFEKLHSKNKILKDSFVLFVDDGSQDSTWRIITQLHQSDPAFSGIKLSRNFGHQHALLAGLLVAKDTADCVISMDADLQDDIELIEEFIDAYIEGYDLVYGVRRARDADTFFKRSTALLFYKLMWKLGVELKFNHADYRLVTKRVLEELENFGETNLFLRGIFPSLGFPSKEVFYDRLERSAGETKYPFKKMLSFAINGITAFSLTPLRMVTALGFTIFIVSLLMSARVLVEALILHNVVPGWSSLALSIYMLSGIQLLCLGVIGEYIGKIYSETKRRPRYIIEKNLMDE